MAKPSRSRTRNPFGLAFLDVMSCGLGAAVLLFLIVDHNVDTGSEQTAHTQEDAQQLETRVAAAEDELEAQREEAERLARELARIAVERVELIQAQAKLPSTGSPADNEDLIRRVRSLEKKVADEKGKQNIARQREGRRQYTAGFRMEGTRVLIALDRSASMTHPQVASVVRTQFLSDAERRRSGKWRHTLTIFEWLLAHLPEDAKFQVLGFAEDAEYATGAGWIPVSDTKRMQRVIQTVRHWVPAGGTDLGGALAKAHGAKPKPDAVYLITDGLPTQGSLGFTGRVRHVAGSKAKVSPSERVTLFERATQSISFPGHHVILLPMEGDPQAPGLLWHFANRTGGQFLAPTPDWP